MEDGAFIRAVRQGDRDAMARWEREVIAGNLDQEELLQAKLLVEMLHRDEEEIDERSARLWKRVNSTVARRKRIRIAAWTSTAAAVLLVAFLGLYQLLLRESSVGANDREAWGLLLSSMEETDKIMLITGKDSINVEGDFAEIDVADDQISVNRETVEKGDEGEEVELLRLIVPGGKRSFVRLPDGSSLWVNSGSRLVYPAKFTGPKREIYLDGEIYGNIAKDPEGKPFSVYTGRMEVTVLGTELNVQAYGADQQEAVVLVTGSVQVKPEKAAARLLVPGNMATLIGETVAVSDVDVQDYISWKDGYIRFREESLANLSRRLSRYYGVTISCDPEVGTVKCSGGIYLQDNLEEVLEGITISLPVTFKKNEESYEIIPKTN